MEEIGFAFWDVIIMNELFEVEIDENALVAAGLEMDGVVLGFGGWYWCHGALGEEGARGGIGEDGKYC